MAEGDYFYDDRYEDAYFFNVLMVDSLLAGAILLIWATEDGIERWSRWSFELIDNLPNYSVLLLLLPII